MTHQMHFYNDQLLLEPTAIKEKEEENKCVSLKRQHEKHQHWILETVYSFLFISKVNILYKQKIFF